MSSDSGPWRLVGQLQAWAETAAWCEWLELSGSLGRGAGDEMSDVDAGLGVTAGFPRDEARAEALTAVLQFAPVADSLVEAFADTGEHLIVQYTDGRQLSLVVLGADYRRGLPPGARAVLDRTGILQQPYEPPVLRASAGQQRQWAFLAWWGLGDVAKHSRRGSVWRAITSLNEVRDLVWRLHAAVVGVDYPLFGAVSVENAGLPVPQGIEATLPDSADPEPILRAATALASVLDPLSAGHDVDGLRGVILARLRG